MCKDYSPTLVSGIVLLAAVIAGFYLITPLFTPQPAVASAPAEFTITGIGQEIFRDYYFCGTMNDRAIITYQWVAGTGYWHRILYVNSGSVFIRQNTGESYLVVGFTDSSVTLRRLN
jgi:hypothetical protein